MAISQSRHLATSPSRHLATSPSRPICVVLRYAPDSVPVWDLSTALPCRAKAFAYHATHYLPISPPGHLATSPPGHLATSPPGHLAISPPGHLPIWPHLCRPSLRSGLFPGMGSNHGTPVPFTALPCLSRHSRAELRHSHIVLRTSSPPGHLPISPSPHLATSPPPHLATSPSRHLPTRPLSPSPHLATSPPSS